jgi:hypothetical protein
MDKKRNNGRLCGFMNLLSDGCNSGTAVMRFRRKLDGLLAGLFAP